jgi:hypothetical protein
MKKLTLRIVAAAAFLLLLTFNITTIQSSTKVTLGGTEAVAAGDLVHCYSSHLECESAPCWHIWKCGTCIEVQANLYEDQLVCTPAPGEG